MSEVDEDCKRITSIAQLLENDVVGMGLAKGLIDYTRASLLISNVPQSKLQKSFLGANSSKSMYGN